MRRAMRLDEDGVAGFFEDLPVLIIVLGAVCILVMTATRISAEIISNDAFDRLQTVAESIIDRVRSEATQLAEVRGAPLLSSIVRLNLTDCAEAATLGGHAYKVVIAVLHPGIGSVVASAGRELPVSTCSAASSTLMNAIDESDRSIVIEARAMVW